MLVSALSVSMFGIYAVAVEDPDLEDVEETSEIQIMPEAERPEVELFNSMDTSIYVGTYWQDDVLHVIPVPDQTETLNEVINSATNSRSPNMPPIIVDSIATLGISAEPVYSMADRDAAHAYLVNNMNSLKIQGVGYTADKLAVFMLPDTSEADRQAVMEMSPVKAIKFMEGGLIDNDFLSNTDILKDANAAPRITSNGLRGGNWARKTSTSNWSTISVSAVRNWNGSSGDIGFITIGHGWTNGQTAYASDGTILGTADVRLYNNMDVTFVKLNNTALNSHGYMNDNSRITKHTAISKVDVFKNIEKYGARTSNTSGRIEAVGITGNWTGYNYNNLFLTSVITRAGDSGAAFVMNNDTIAGIMVGARNTSGTTGPANDPTYLESVVLPIQAIIDGPGFIPCT